MLQVMRIIDCIRPDKQTVMFSATFPRQMEALARKILDKPIEVMCLHVKVRKNGQHATCLATLLQNVLNSDAARFATHVKPVLQESGC